MGRGAYEACKQKAHRHQVRRHRRAADEGRKLVADGVLDASIEYPTCGAAAVDLALLALHQIALPKELILARACSPRPIPLASRSPDRVT